MTAKTYRLIEHTADLGMEVYGNDAVELFANAALALSDILLRKTGLAIEDTTEFKITGDDPPDLLVNWLRELLYLWTVHHRLINKVEITRLTENSLDAVAHTHSPPLDLLDAAYEIKAVTYHQVAVESGSSGWRCQVFFDI